MSIQVCLREVTTYRLVLKGTTYTTDHLQYISIKLRKESGYGMWKDLE